MYSHLILVKPMVFKVPYSHYIGFVAVNGTHTPPGKITLKYVDPSSAGSAHDGHALANCVVGELQSEVLQ